MLTRRSILSFALASTVVRSTAARASPQTYDGLLAGYVAKSADGINRVDYRRWKGNEADTLALKDVIRQQEAVRVSAWATPQQFVYWSNLYNAVTLDVVLDHYPVASIRDIKSDGVWLDPKAYSGPWVAKRVTVEGQTLSLDDIEHGILRTKFKDPRVHYAVNCASLGCPNLRPRPWHAETLVDDLEQAARDYINHPRAAIVTNDGKLTVSSIYRWFVQDFGGSDAGIISHLRKYAAPDLGRRLAQIKSISSDRYDWTINGV